ncbi:DNA methyltransferase [Pseudoalteromonas sp. XMcav11-Q]|uniref:DNA methyltransferase n=1 Tax=Pseudoalteromonas sp. XMcav11-Q TaxID=3136665 RepID=UPI0032C3DEB4
MTRENIKIILNNWESFKGSFPHTLAPFSKRNWGSPLHSVCSYQGKMKPALAYHLIKTFTREGDIVLDPFSGSGTIPFEASLNGRIGLGLDIGELATSLSNAKLMEHNEGEIRKIISQLENFISNNEPSSKSQEDTREIGFNKTIPDYFHPQTLKEIQLARDFFSIKHPESGSWSLVFSCMLHILHGNRPYALSRTSHPITPYAPTGEFIYKSVIEKLTDKVNRSLNVQRGELFSQGHCYQADILSEWPQEIKNVNAIITSPPFFDSTKFYMANWMRYWFCGWGKADFQENPKSFVETLQKSTFEIYDRIFEQCSNRLVDNGIAVFHLGHSAKCNMAEELLPYSNKYFNHIDTFTESVEHCESHGIKDKGSVKGHQYLVLIKK